ncbi:hypothetical protein LCGC14_1643260 [marine sediment metagenome]|uniref:NTP pyrophosphohydrolase MazG putative catalytic core domain-containing protein n=1 Tax=marine sediment metagenome TaxID=412755 RepID=A0A0F9ILI9_9ZZZZ
MAKWYCVTHNIYFLRSGVCNSCIGEEPDKGKSFIAHITGLAQSVLEFHTRFELQDSDDLDNMKFRNQLLTEEVGEVAKALNYSDYSDAVRESVDVAYVALGTLLAHIPESFIHIAEVIEKNAQKNLNTHRIETGGKVVRQEPETCTLCTKPLLITGEAHTYYQKELVHYNCYLQISEQEAFERGG